jgi:hypothetical protein
VANNNIMAKSSTDQRKRKKNGETETVSKGNDKENEQDQITKPRAVRDKNLFFYVF